MLDSTAKVIVRVTDPGLSLPDRDRAVEVLFSDLERLEVTPIADLRYVEDPEAKGHYRGVQIFLAEPETVRDVLGGLSDYLTDIPAELEIDGAIEILVLIELQRKRHMAERIDLRPGLDRADPQQIYLQVQTRRGEDLLALRPAIDHLLPVDQIFQARAETYALRGGGLSPVDRANLELLRHQLNLPPERAEAIIERTLGPYLERQAKLQKYREVLHAELDRKYPLDESTWAELRKLYKNLGLSAEDVKGIEDEHVSNTVLKLTQKKTAEKEKDETQAQQAKLTHYEQEFRKAIANTLYPSDYDRGWLEKTRLSLNLDSQQVAALEQRITDEMHGSTASDKNLDYSRLRQLLRQSQWAAADQETERLLLSAVSPDMSPLTRDLVMALPCRDLQTIDELWVRYSSDRFGFRAQQRVFYQAKKQVDEFLQAVGWQENIIGSLITRHKAYQDFQFNLSAPMGHLPSWRWSCPNVEGQYIISDVIVDAVFSHLEKCLPTVGIATFPLNGIGGQ